MVFAKNVSSHPFYLIYLSLAYLINARDIVWLVKKRKCCGGLFADDIVLLVSSKSSLKNLLNKSLWLGYQK